uniref:Uncharacterized protein n=1 Tax=Meloidogyne floridensis TaxID=298350 RepID=A0A915NKK7_9BILA
MLKENYRLECLERLSVEQSLNSSQEESSKLRSEATEIRADNLADDLSQELNKMGEELDKVNGKRDAMVGVNNEFLFENTFD